MNRASVLSASLFLMALSACTANAGDASPVNDGSDDVGIDALPGERRVPTVIGEINADRFRDGCDVTAGFTRVQAVGGVPVDGTLGAVTLSPDELELYATERTSDSASTYYRLVRMTRSSALASFTPAPEVATAAGLRFESALTLSRDGLSLYVTVEVPSHAMHLPPSMEMRVAHRAVLSGDFGAFTPTGLTASSPLQLSQISPDATSAGLLASATFAVQWRIKEIPFSAFTLSTDQSAQAALDPNVMAQGAVATRDGRYAYVGAGGTTASGATLFSLALAEKSPTAARYGTPVVLSGPVKPDANHGGIPQWLASNNCRLYYLAQSTSAAGGTLQVATKTLLTPVGR